jgi:hypothetical protein
MSLSSSMRLFLVAAAVVVLPSLAVADTITFSAPNISLTESSSVQTGYFDIVISDTANSNTATNAQGGGNGANLNTTGSDAINGFDVEVVVGNGVNSPVTLIAGSDQTQANSPYNGASTYIFSTDSTVDPSFNGSNTNQENPNYNANMTQSLQDEPNGAATTLAGTPLGLLQVEYSIPANYTGTVALSLPDGNSDVAYGALFLDSSYSPDIPNLVNGSITVTPEPSSVVMLILGAVGLFGIRRLRARG